MKLVHLSIASIIGCVLGLAALLGVALMSLDRMHEKQAEMANLFALRERIDDFSAASDSLLLFGAGPGLWQAYRADARSLQDRLQHLGSAYPDARRAARRIATIVDALAAAGVPVGASAREARAANGAGPGPLDIPGRARLVVNNVAGHGTALDTALDKALRARQEAIADEATWIAGGFAGAAGLFGALCVLAFGLIHQRITRPTAILAGVMDRLRAGDTTARARLGGNDELARLGGTFDRLLDEQQRAEQSARADRAALEERERMLAESQRIAHIGSWRLVVDDNRLEWSEETYRIAGVSPASFTPSPDAFFELVHPDDRDRLLTSVDAAVSGGQLHDTEFRIVRPDGEVRHVHELAERSFDPDAGGCVFAGTIQDVTEQKRADEHLRWYHRLIEGSEDLFAIKDAGYRCVLCNRAYARLYGLEPADLEGAYLPDLLGHEFFEREARPPIDRGLAGQPSEFQAVREYPGLSRRNFLIRYYPLPSADGSIGHVGAIVTDITGLRQAEAELREQARLLDIAGRTARLGGWSVDLASGVTTWSDVTAEIHGMPHGYAPDVESAIGFCAPEYRDRVRALFSGCAERGEPYDEELQIVTADGERVWVRAVGEPVRDGAGNITGVQGAFQDVSAQKAADQELERLADRLRTTLESITDAFYTLDRDWRFTYVNAEAEKLLRRPKTELLGRDAWTEFPDAAGTAIEQALQRAMREGTTEALEEYYPPLGKWLDIRAYPSSEGLAVFFRDVTERHEMLRQLREQEESLRTSRDRLAHTLNTRQALINALPAHIALLDADGDIRDVNERWRHFGRDNGHADPGYGMGTNYLAVCEAAARGGDDEARRAREGLRAVLNGNRETFVLEYACHSPDRQRWFRMMANALGDEHAPALDAAAVVMHVDITERKLAEQELQRVAYRDALTGVLSRQGFARRLEDELQRTGWQPGGSVVMLNVRNQRDVNEAHGYAAGDEVLKRAAERLLEAAGADALVGRPGGDEFAIFLPERSDADPAARRRALAEVFDLPVELEQASVSTSAHFAFTVLGERRRSSEELVREAAVALFRGREEPFRGTWKEYTPEVDAERHDRVQLTRDLQRALERHEFQLHFQPKVELASGELVAAEALLRWYHPEHGLQSPGRFIPVAEQSQLIAPIGDWVLRDACRQLREWQDAGLDIVRIAVNVSLVQFMVGDFATTVRDALDAYGVTPANLTLEITESVFEQESEELRRQLRALHELGVRLSLDDFGTGYSSLLFLQRYPFDEIKIDQGFVRRMTEDGYSRRIVATVLGLAGALGAEPVAEGVEDEAVRDALVATGCRIGQGFHYSMPLEAEDFRWLLERRSALPLRGRDAQA